MWVTRFNGTRLYINAELIQTVEATPDTVITLVNGTKVVVKDPAEDVIGRIVEYQRKVRGPQPMAAAEDSHGS